jgi:lipid-A-disaccharide synthase
VDAPRIFIVAGEASGDMHGGALARAILAACPGARLSGVGGPAMKAAGVALRHTIDEFAVLGISEVMSRLPFFFRVMGEMKDLFRRDPPDLVIPIDFPDFNIRLAGAAKSADIPVLYYISPQIWAWRRGRIRTLARVVDRMVVIFPFETEIYRAAGVPVDFVGHPLLERVRTERTAAEVRRGLGIADGKPLVALLPGSRHQEIARLLPPLADAAAHLETRGVATVVSRAGSVPAAWFETALAGKTVRTWEGSPYDLVAAADLAVVASGTATLETGLLGTPLIVVYRMSPLTWAVARTLVRLPYIGLVNIAAGRKIAPELLQGEVTGDRVAGMVLDLLTDPPALARMRQELESLPQRLGGPGASERTARIALDLALARRAAPVR